MCQNELEMLNRFSLDQYSLGLLENTEYLSLRQGNINLYTGNVDDVYTILKLMSIAATNSKVGRTTQL